MLVLLVVLGTVLFVRSRSSAENSTVAAVSSTAATSTAPAPRTTSAPPPLPSSLAPSSSSPPPTTPPPTAPTSTAATPTDGTPAGPADVSAITALSQQLIDALNTGDAKGIEAVTCGTLRTQAEKGTEPPTKKITYDRTEDVTVDGDAGTAKVFASNSGKTPTPATMEVQRLAGTWKACNLR